MVKDTITCSSCTEGRPSKRLQASSSITCIGIVPLTMCEPTCMHLKAVDMLVIPSEAACLSDTITVGGLLLLLLSIKYCRHVHLSSKLDAGLISS